MLSETQKKLFVCKIEAVEHANKVGGHIERDGRGEDAIYTVTWAEEAAAIERDRLIAEACCKAARRITETTFMVHGFEPATSYTVDDEPSPTVGDLIVKLKDQEATIASLKLIALHRDELLRVIKLNEALIGERHRTVDHLVAENAMLRERLGLNGGAN